MLYVVYATDSSQCIRIREKTLKFSSAVLSTLSAYFMPGETLV